MDIKEKPGVESETWEESKTKVKVFLQQKLGLGPEEITIKRAHRIEKKKERRRRTIIANFLNYKQREKLLSQYKELFMGESILYKRRLQRVYC